MAVEIEGATHAREGFQPVDEELRSVPVEVAGALPPWLRGTLVRVTPSLEAPTGERPVVRHWFDGLAMLHGFSFGPDGVTYTSRWVDSNARRRSRDGRWGVTGFGTDPCRTLGQRVMSLFDPSVNDNPNVNVCRLGDQCLAWTETPYPVEFDEQTLETVGTVKFSDKLGGHYSTAHPHHDRERNELINIVTHAARAHSYRVYALPAGSKERRLIAEVPAKRPGYQHSFALTERHVVLFEQPWRYDLRKLLLRDSTVMDVLRWHPDEPSRVIVIDKASGAVVRDAELPALFTFHTVNAFERDGELVLDLVAWTDPMPVWALVPERLQNPDDPLSAFAGWLERLTVPLAGGGVGRERLSEARIEFPRINYRRSNGRDYRYAYAVEYRDAASDWFDGLVRFDLETGTEDRWSQDGCYPGEPVFVPDPAGTDEDHGVLLSAVFDATTGTSFLLVLDASTFEEVARAAAPQRLPFNFHQDFFGAR